MGVELAPLASFSVVVPLVMPRVLRALLCFGNYRGVESAITEQLLGERLAARTVEDRAGRAKLSCDFCAALITEALLFPAAAQRRSLLREVHLLAKGVLGDVSPKSHPLVPAMQVEMCASHWAQCDIDDWVASVAAVTSGLLVHPPTVQFRAA